MRSPVLPALVTLLLALAAPAQAQRDGETLDRILPEIRAAHPGRLSDARAWIDDRGGVHYRIKWMTPEGRILYFDADARTGHVSSSGGDDDQSWRRRNPRSESHDEDRPPAFDGPRDNWSGGSRDHNDGAGDWRGGHDTGDNEGWHHHRRGEN